MKQEVPKGDGEGAKPVWLCVECREIQYHDGSTCYVKHCKAQRRYIDEEGATNTRPKKEREYFTMRAVGEEVITRL